MKEIRRRDYDEPLMDIVNKALAAQKREKNAFSWYIKMLIVSLAIISVILLFLNPLSSSSGLLIAFFLFNSTLSLKKSHHKTVVLMIKGIIDRANDYKKTMDIYDPATTVEIVPRNLKVGDDLEGCNIVPIFKEGKYVIVKSMLNPYFIRMVNDEKGEEHNYLMEPTKEDLETLANELPEYKEYIKSLSLKSHELPIL